VRVASAGDINADGKDDVVVSSGPDSYVVFGDASTQAVDLSQLGGRGYRISGPGGVFVQGPNAGVGDVNGDGLDDLLLVDRVDAANDLFWVVFGKTNTANQVLGSLGNGGFSIGPRHEGPSLCVNTNCDRIGGAGDINGDGRDDLIVGLPRRDVHEYDDEAGAVFVVFGKASSDPVDVESMPVADGYRIVGSEQNEQLGRSVTGVGDMNGDGRDDLAITSNTAAYVVFGQTFFRELAVANLGTGGFAISDSDVGLDSPAVDGGGDVGGDANPDVLISNRYTAYLIYGKSTTDAIDLAGWPSGDTDQGFAVRTARPDLALGFWVPAIAGDIAGSSHADLLLSGRTSLIHGGDHPDSAIIVCALGTRGTLFTDVGGAASATDFNGDGIFDVVGFGPNGPVVFFGPTFTASACPNPDGAWLAERFAPRVLLDVSERWHPLDVNAFLSERFNDPANDPPLGAPLPEYHFACPGVVPDDGFVCDPVRGPGDLERSAYEYLDVRGNVDEPESYRMPGCTIANPDCAGVAGEGNPVGSIYFSFASTTAYQYVNYWWFFRFNDAPAAGDLLGQDHEGDWEGVSVAVPNNTTETFDFGVLEAHGTLWRYLRDAMRCGGTTAAEPCTYAERPGGTAGFNAYVASGTHASYPAPCVSGCRQTTDGDLIDEIFALPENPYGGEIPARLDEPAPLDFRWAAFGGSWGYGKTVASPAAPGQSRYYEPWENQCTTRFSASSCPASSVASPDGSASGGGDTAPSAPCDPWFGPSVGAVVCDAEAITTALAAGQVGQGESTTLTGPPGMLSASGEGVAQLVGRMLRPGDSAIVESESRNAAVLFARAATAETITEAAFPVAGNSRGVLQVTQVGQRAVLALSRGGESVNPLGTRHISNQP
jgi:FG-GAP repeat